MTFKNLESRFNENVNRLYSAGTLKFENGKPSNGRNDDPLIVRKPGNGYWGFGEDRSLPVRSALIDVKRLTLFTLSKRGLLFLAKQQLLQTGNTFEQTRLINPLFTVGNAVPFLHLRRHLRPITGGPGGALLAKTDVSYANVRKLGQLQKSTYDSFTQNAGGGIGAFFKKLAGPITNTISAFTAKKNIGEEFGYGTPSSAEGWKKSRPELGKSDKDYAVGFRPPAFKFGGNISTVGFTRSVYGAIPSSPGSWNGNYTTYLTYSNDKKTWPLTRQTDYASYRLAKYKKAVLPERSEVAIQSDIKEEYRTASDYQKLLNSQIEDTAYLSYDRDNNQKYKAADGLLFASLSPKNVSVPTLNKDLSVIYGTGKIRSREGETRENVNTGREAIDSQISTAAEYQGKAFVRYFSAGNVGLASLNASEIIDGKTSNMQERIKAFRTGPAQDKRLTYLKDESNLPAALPNNAVSKKAYQSINNAFDDPIVVSFAMGTDGPIRFRAFIKDLTQTATPDYKPYQYIGRMERFVSYIGVQREISFKLGVIAFSKEELDGCWKRINYLTGLVFPYGFNRGIFQPNIVRLTIGDVYTEQPGYVTALSTNFNELGTSWEIDGGRQVPIAAEMDIKFTIIEKSSKVADSPFYGITEKMEGFATNLTPSKTITDNTDSTNDAPSNDTPVKVNVETRTSQKIQNTFLPDNTRVTPRNPAPNNSSPQARQQALDRVNSLFTPTSG
jgi:hypothetical protein